jgi:hypothetical protein
MKIWNGYGSEHSMNLVMIGTFRKVDEATKTKNLIDQLAEQVRKEPMRQYEDDPKEARFSNEMLDFFIKTNIHSIGSVELDQFHYDVNVEQKGNKLVFKTDESEVSAFMKLLIEHGAKVEVFSAHDYPEEKH